MDVSSLNQVLKYGRLRPAEDWEAHIDQMHNDRKGTSGQDQEKVTELHRLVLADKFAEEGDPREHILRAVGTPESKKLEQGTSDFWEDGKPAATHERVKLSDGSSLSVWLRSPYSSRTAPSHVRMTWFAKTPEDGMMGFHTHYKPDHAKAILQQFHPDDAPGIDKLIALIDKHFPKPEGGA